MGIWLLKKACRGVDRSKSWSTLKIAQSPEMAHDWVVHLVTGRHPSILASSSPFGHTPLKSPFSGYSLESLLSCMVLARTSKAAYT